MLFGLNENTIPANEEPQTIAHRHYEETRIKVKSKYENKIFLSLSRVNRPHRSLSTYEIFNSDIFLDGLVSHDKIKHSQIEHIYNQMPRGHNIHWKQFNDGLKLPLTVDHRFR